LRNKLGDKQAEIISQPFASKLKKKRSKSHEKRKTKEHSRNKKLKRKSSVTIAIQKEESNNLTKYKYKNIASNFESIASSISDFDDASPTEHQPVAQQIEHAS